MSHELNKIIAELRETQQEYANGAMQFPKPDPFEHGVQVGVWRGVQLALDTIDAVLSEQAAQDAKR